MNLHSDIKNLFCVFFTHVLIITSILALNTNVSDNVNQNEHPTWDVTQTRSCALPSFLFNDLLCSCMGKIVQVVETIERGSYAMVNYKL